MGLEIFTGAARCRGYPDRLVFLSFAELCLGRELLQIQGDIYKEKGIEWNGLPTLTKEVFEDYSLDKVVQLSLDVIKRGIGENDIGLLKEVKDENPVYYREFVKWNINGYKVCPYEARAFNLGDSLGSYLVLKMQGERDKKLQAVRNS